MILIRFRQTCFFRLILATGISVCSVSPLFAQTVSTPLYDIVEYASLEDYGASVVVRNINSLKEITGSFKRQNEKKISQAFVLTASGIEDVVNDPGIDYSTTYDLNDRNEIVGAVNTLTALRPFRSRRQQSLQMLLLLPGDSGGIAYAINDNGEAAGYSSGKNGERAVWWPLNGPARLLRSLPNSDSRALGMNDNGDIVGTSASANKQAVLWPDKGQPIALPTLPGFVTSEAVSISNTGNIAGYAMGTQAAPNYSRAVLWTVHDQTALDLGALTADGESRASDVNDRGDVVGTTASGHDNHAFIWNAETGMRDLNALIEADSITLTDAISINGNGDIVAIGFEHDHTETTDFQTPHEEDDHQDHERPRKIFVLTPR